MSSRKLLTLLRRRGGKSWIEKNALLYDTFKTAASAPITSPRTCEPGPGLLVVVDTGNKLSLSDGDLVGAAGAGWGDPGVWLGRDNAGSPATQTLGVGNAAFLDITPGATGKLGRFGFDADASGNLIVPYFLFLDSGSALMTGGVSSSTYSTARMKLLQVLRSTTKGFYYIKDGKLLWVCEGARLAAAYIGFTPYDMPFTAPDLDLLPLASYNPAWGGDWTEVTGTKVNPSSPIAFNCAADCHINYTHTHETLVNADMSFRRTDANNRAWLRVGGGGAPDQLFLINTVGGADSILATVNGLFADATSYKIDIVAYGSSVKVYVDNVLKIDEVATDNQSTSGGYSEHPAIADMVITTHPYPALGIATSRVVCPQTTNTYTHAADFIAEIKNVTLPAADNLSFQFRISGSDELTLNIASDGSLAFLDNATSRITAAGATVSDDDDIVLVCDGANGQIFVNGTSVGTTTAIAHLTGTAGKRLDATTGQCDHVAFFPRDVSDLLPKGTF